MIQSHYLWIIFINLYFWLFIYDLNELLTNYFS